MSHSRILGSLPLRVPCGLAFRSFQKPVRFHEPKQVYEKIHEALTQPLNKVYGNMQSITWPFDKLKTGSWTDYASDYEVAKSKTVLYHHSWIPTNIVDSLDKKQKVKSFAVIAVKGHQFKVTEGDVIITHAELPYDINEPFVIDEVLLAGSVRETLIGRPLVSGCLVRATIEEKTKSDTTIVFKKKKRKRYQRTYEVDRPINVIRINEIVYQPQLAQEQRNWTLPSL